jgi:putative heme-binding domain-containing protein
LQTLRLLGRKSIEPDAIVRTLRSAAGEGNPSEVRIEAVTQLFVRDPRSAMEVARLIIDSKSAKIPEKQAVVAALRGRSDVGSAKLVQELVDRLAARKLDAGLKLDVFTLARESGSTEIVSALRKYLAASPKGGLKMASPDLPYELLTAGGDAARGRLVANEHLAANCTACHRFESDEGSEVGPLLKAVGLQRTPAELAESLVNPSAKIVPGFGFETLTLKNGETVAGVVTSEPGLLSKSYALRLPDGTKRSIPATELAARTPPVSIMPPMLGILTPGEIRDLVAYLGTLRPKDKKAKK